MKTLLESVIVLSVCTVGLGMCTAGVVLAFKERTKGLFVTYLCGAVLVIVGGPLSSRLKSLTFTGTKLSVSLEQTSLPKDTAEAVKDKATESLAAAVFRPPAAAQGAQAKQDAEQLGGALTRYISDAGFTPASATSANFSVGSLIRVTSEGRMILVGRPEDFGVTVAAQTNSLPIATEIKLEGADESNSTATKIYLKEPTAESASLVALRALLERAASSDFKDCYVVSSLLSVKALEMTDFNGKRSKVPESEEDKSTKAAEMRLSISDRLVLGYQFIRPSPTAVE